MLPTFLAAKSKPSGSTSRWLARQSSDPYVKARLAGSLLPSVPSSSNTSKDAADSAGGEQTYRSRASYKLLEMWKRFPGLMRKGWKVVDLGAAPGGWCQVAQRATGPTGLVIGVDLLPILPMHRVTLLQGNFLSPSVQGEVSRILEERLGAEMQKRLEKRGKRDRKVERRILGMQGDGSFGLRESESATSDIENSELEPGEEEEQSSHDEPSHLPMPDSTRLYKVDTVLSDMMANVSGLRERDVGASLELCEAALEFAVSHLSVGRKRTEEEMREERESGVVVKGKRGGKKAEEWVGGGSLVMKHFQHPDLNSFQRERLLPIFRSVKVEKPKSSRAESKEAFFVCQGFKGLPDV